MLLTFRGWSLLAFIALGILFLERTGQAAFLELVTLSASALLVSLASLRRLGGGLTVRRDSPVHIFAGEKINVRLDCVNHDAPKSLFLLSDVLELPEGEKRAAIPVDVLKTGERRTFSYAVPTTRRGVCRFSRITLESGAPFGLLAARREHAVPGETLVLPYPGKVWEWECPGGRRHSGTGIESLDRTGATHEYHSTREYRPEDPMRTIHWKLTARMNKLMVREFQTTSSLETEIIPNLHKADYRSAEGAEMLEGIVALAASLAAELIRLGHFVRLWLPRRRVVSTLQEPGTAHLTRILSELARAVADGEEPYSNAIARLRAGFTPRAAAVCLTPYLNLPDAATAVSSLRADGFSPFLMVMEPSRAHDARRRDEAHLATPEAAIEAAIARSLAPAWRFYADEDFRDIRMRRHEARQVGYRAGPVGAAAG